MKLIDADALHKAYMELRNFKQDPQSGDWISLRAVPLTTVIRMLNDAPSIDIEPKRGKWIAKTENYHFHWVCSECGSWALLEYNEQMCLSDFCPNCGADMRKGADDDKV